MHAAKPFDQVEQRVVLITLVVKVAPVKASFERVGPKERYG
jgi:hypothetical protein